MRSLLGFIISWFVAILFSSSAISQDNVVNYPKLYRMNCGEITVHNLNIFSDTDLYVGRSRDLVVSCYLIVKGDKILLWDTGLPSDVLDHPEKYNNAYFSFKLKRTIPSYLEDLNLTVDDIDYVGISHGHMDHAGNVGLFKNSQLLIQKDEFDFFVKRPEEALSYHVDRDLFSYFLTKQGYKKLDLIQGDRDVFGDGTVRMISLPGHTPGHMALLIELENIGTVVLSGDQWHFDDNRDHDGVPSFNYNRADTLASSDRLNRLVMNSGAKLIIQHEFNDIPELPLWPKYAK